MNVYDSSRMMDVLIQDGYTQIHTPKDADLIILNTCHIREKAAEKVYSDLGRLKPEKKRNPNLIIILAGCVAQAEGEAAIKRMPIINMVIGPQNYHRIPEFIEEIESKHGRIVDVDLKADEKFDALPTPQTSKTAAYVVIQEGCDNFCTFCVVPYTRGREYSRPPADILKEIQALTEQGVVEVTLLGQNVNSYKQGDCTLADLIKKVAEIDAIKRIKFFTSNPQSMTDELISLYKTEPKLMPFIHLPIQSGSDKILKKMNRKHEKAEYLDIIKRLREARPDIAVSGDFIVGFPDETDEDFEETLSLVKAVKYAQAYSFKYSPRPKTPAAKMENQIDETVKSERLERLQDLLNEQQIEFNRNSIGKQFEILIERDGKYEGQLIGRSPYMQSVYIVGDSFIMDKLVKVEIEDAFGNSLKGKAI